MTDLVLQIYKQTTKNLWRWIQKGGTNPRRAPFVFSMRRTLRPRRLEQQCFNRLRQTIEILKYQSAKK